MAGPWEKYQQPERQIRPRGGDIEREPAPPPNPDRFEQSRSLFEEFTDPAVRREALGDFLQPVATNVLQPINTGLAQMFGLRDTLAQPEAGNITRGSDDPIEGVIPRSLETIGQGLGVGALSIPVLRAAQAGVAPGMAAAQAARNPAMLPTASAPGIAEPAAGTAIRAMQAPGVAPHLAAQGGAATFQNPLMAGLAESGAHIAGHPLSSLAAELAGGAGAGAAMETARLSGASPEIEGLAGMIGGPAAIMAPGLGLRAGAGVARRAVGAAEDFMPLPQGTLDRTTGSKAAFLPGGRRAAARVQALASDPEDAVAKARAAPEGVTPARATGDKDLQALERRILAESPGERDRIATGLEDFRQAQGDELRTLQGAGRPRGEWQQSVMERVKAPGADPIPAGATDEMLDAAYRSYDTAYEQAKGFPVALARLGDTADLDRPLGGLLRQAANTRETPIGAIDAKGRARMAKDLEGAFQDVQRRVARGQTERPPGTVDSDTMLEFRSVLRAQARAYRRQARGGGSGAEESKAKAVLLENAEKRVTEALESQLPKDASDMLKATDANYREFKTVEDAVFRSGDRELRPESLQQAIRASHPSRGAVARGEAEDMAAVARAGTPASKVAGDPQAASRLVRGMAPEQARQVRADFNEHLFSKAQTPPRERDAAQFVSGKKLTAMLDQERDTMRALGYSADDLKRMDRIAANLRMAEAKDPQELSDILTDQPGRIMRFVAAAAGSSAGRAVAKKLGGGMTHSLIIAHTGSRIGREVIEDAVADNATALLKKAVTDPELYAALLTRPTDSLPRRQAAGRALGGWVAETLGLPKGALGYPATALGPQIEAASDTGEE